MLLLAAIAIAASTPTNAPGATAPVTVQARASVRIISAARISFTGQNDPGVPVPIDTLVHTASEPQPARLIEFQ